MTGRKTLSEVRVELEAALGAGPTGDGEVAESLRRFLAAESGRQNRRNQAQHPPGEGSPVSEISRLPDAPPAGELDR